MPALGTTGTPTGASVVDAWPLWHSRVVETRHLPLLLLTIAACKAGAVGEVLEPDTDTAAQALGETLVCEETDRVEPLTVDWGSADRADLEVAMRDGLVVAAYDCNTLRVLDGCRVEGGYSFAGVSRKEEVVSLRNHGELKANMPLGEVNFSAVIERGSTVDVALVTVGKYRTTAGQVSGAELVGDCEGATHYVRSAMVGAFAIGTGTVGNAATVAQLFDLAEAGASSKAESKGLDRDGELASCQASSPEQAAPPAQCQALLRVELQTILDPNAVAPQPSQPNGQATAACPKGFVSAGGKCASAPEAEAYACDPSNQPECLAQCEAGSAESCQSAGFASNDLSFHQRACELGLPEGCTATGYALAKQAGESGKDPKLVEQALAMQVAGCDAGDAAGCLFTGRELLFGETWSRQPSLFDSNPDKGRAMMERAAKLGHPRAASELAWSYFATQKTKAAAVLEQDCERGNGVSCTLLGGFLTGCADGRLPGMLPADVEECGAYPKKDPARGVKMFERACRNGFPGTCATAGKRYAEGRDVEKDNAKAASMYQLGCPLNSGSVGFGTCEAFGAMLEAGDGVTKDLELAATYQEKACSYGSKAGCFDAGRLRGELGDAEQQKALWTDGCLQHRGRRACESLVALHEAAGDADAATEVYKETCLSMRDKDYCDTWVERGGKLEKGFKPIKRTSKDPDQF